MCSHKSVPHPIQQAVDEQAKSAFPEPVIDGLGQLVKGLFKNRRRRTETILNEAVDKSRKVKKRQNHKNTKKIKRRRKRGPRVYSVHY